MYRYFIFQVNNKKTIKKSAQVSCVASLITFPEGVQIESIRINSTFGRFALSEITLD